MKRHVFFFALLVATLAFKEENDMPVLFDKNINQFLQKHRTSLLFFYTPQCGHCERFQPEVEKAAKQLKEESIAFGKVDGHNYKDIAKKFEVTGYPSVILSLEHGNKYLKFEGTRTSDSVILWMFEQINPGSQLVESVYGIKQKIVQSDCVFLYIAPDETDRGFRRYKEFSHTYSNVVFLHTFLPGIHSDLGVSSTDTLIAFKKYDQSPSVFKPKQLKVAELKAFVESNMYPRLVEYNEELKKRIFKQDRNALVLFADQNNVKDKNAVDAVMKVALEHPQEDQMLFIKVSPTNQHYSEILESIGDHGGMPALIAFTKLGVYKYVFTKAFTSSNLEAFIQEVKSGKATRFYKSQKLENKKMTQHVEILTGNSYGQVMTSKADWVVLYYNSYDSAHQEVLAEFQQVAEQIGSVSTVRFGAADVTKNEFHDFSDSIDVVKVRLYKGDKNFAKFIVKTNKIQRDRFITFIKEQSNYEFSEEHHHRHDDL